MPRFDYALSMNTEETFWARCTKSDGCWQWTGMIGSKGYGKFSFKGQRWHAHRLAYTFSKGPIPDGKFVCHKCDNKKCVNPSHLFIGTALDNNRDCITKGRRHAFDMSKILKTGEDNPSSKLDRVKVAAIMPLKRSGMTWKQIATLFGVAPITVRRAGKGISWRP